MKRRKTSSKRGAVFSLDATLAILFSIIVIISVNAYFNRITYNKMFLGHPSEAASDVMNLMQKTNLLESFYLENEFFFNNTVMDSKGLNHGTYNAPAYIISNTYNYYDHRLVLDGSNGYVNVSNAPELNFDADDDFSISLWVKRESNNEDILISKGDIDDEVLTLKIDSIGQVVAIVASETLTSSQTITNDNLWHQIVLVVQKSTTDSIKIYIDNQTATPAQLNIVTPKSPSSTNDMLIGVGEQTSLLTSYFKGELDDIIFFSKALSTTEINKLYAKESINPNIIIAKYDFNPIVSKTIKSINNSIDNYLPKQYAMIVQMKDSNNIIISNGQQPDVSSVNNFITSGERMVTINKSDEIINIVRVRYYAWTK